MRKLNFGSAFRERKTGRQRHSHCPISSHSPIIIEIVPDIPAPPTHVHFIVDTTPSPLDQLLRGLAAPPRALPLTLRCCFPPAACLARLLPLQPAAAAPAGLTRKRVLQPRSPIQSHTRRVTPQATNKPPATMASTANGEPAPSQLAQEPAADPAANKRKREPSEPSTDHAVRLSQTQSDILAIVKEYARRRITL